MLIPNPIELEKILKEHFGYLFQKNDSIVVSHSDLNFSWLRCALTEKGRAILIDTDSPHTPFTSHLENPRQTRRGRIRMEEVAVVRDNGDDAHSIAIYCNKASLSVLFNRLMADLIWHLVTAGPQDGDPWNFLSTRLDGWRALFSGTDSKAEEKGLIGELVFLKHLLTTSNHSIEVWDGPLQGIKDFRLPNCNVEVKATTIRQGYFIEVSGLFQATEMQLDERLLFVRLEESPNGSVSVKRLIQEVSAAVAARGETDVLAQRLKEYSPETVESDTKWEVLETVIFRIDEDFPRLSAESFVQGQLPAGVLGIRWTADLTALERTELRSFIV